MLTWFWMRSLTRSMGAAAVFETAAETPPTDKLLVAAACAKLRRQRSHHLQVPMAHRLMELSMEIDVLKKSTTKPGIPNNCLSCCAPDILSDVCDVVLRWCRWGCVKVGHVGDWG